MHISSIYLKHQVHEMFPLCRLIQPIWRSRFVHFFKLIHKQPFTPLTYRKGSEWQEFTVVHHHRCVSVYVNYWTDCIYCFMKHSLASSDISLILHLHSVLFKLGESVHLTSSVPGNQSAFFHPLIAVTMTTPNNPQQRAGWWVSQQTQRSDDGGHGGGNEKRGQWKKKNQTPPNSPAPEREESGFPSVAHKWSTGMYDFNRIFWKQCSVFHPPVSLSLSLFLFLTICSHPLLWHYQGTKIGHQKLLTNQTEGSAMTLTVI